VQISRLRQRLEKFYQLEGAACAERIVVPLGSHHIEMEVVMQAEPGVPALPEVPKPPPHNPVSRLLLGACAVLALLAAGLGIITLRTVRPGTPRDAPRFWRAFFANRLPTRIILPTPVFFSFAPSDPLATVMVRDTSINDFADRARSAQYPAIRKLMGEPQLAQN